MTEQTFTELPDGLETIMDCEADTVVLVGDAARVFLYVVGADPLLDRQQIVGRLEDTHDDAPFGAGVQPEGRCRRRVWCRRYCPPVAE